MNPRGYGGRVWFSDLQRSPLPAPGWATVTLLRAASPALLQSLAVLGHVETFDLMLLVHP